MESIDIGDGAGTPEPQGRGIFAAGAISAIATCILIAAAVGLYFVWPYSPDRLSTAEILEFLGRDPLGALVSLDILMLLIAPINLLVFISLSAALYRRSATLSAAALVCGLIAFVCLIICRPLAELLSLSGKFALAADLPERAALIAAAEGLLSYFKGTAWAIQTALYPAAGLIYAFLMRKSTIFSKADSVVGMIVSATALGFILPKVGMIFLFANTIGTIPWYLMITRRLIALAKRPRA